MTKSNTSTPGFFLCYNAFLQGFEGEKSGARRQISNFFANKGLLVEEKRQKPRGPLMIRVSTTDKSQRDIVLIGYQLQTKFGNKPGFDSPMITSVEKSTTNLNGADESIIIRSEEFSSTESAAQIDRILIHLKQSGFPAIHCGHENIPSIEVPLGSLNSAGCLKLGVAIHMAQLTDVRFVFKKS